MTASESTPTPSKTPTGSNPSASSAPSAESDSKLPSVDPYPNTLFDILISPPLEKLGLYNPPDPTYGRYLLPNSGDEKELEEGSVRMGMRRVFLRDGKAIFSSSGPIINDQPGAKGGNGKGEDKDGNGGGVRGEDVKLDESELKNLGEGGRSREWVFYKMWQRGVWNRCDVVCIHGMNDYGGKWVLHLNRMLDAGYRIIAPDLPSHGRSTGLHVHLTSADQLSDAVHAVLLDLAGGSSKPDKVFLVGSSLGAFTALSYCLRYPIHPSIPLSGVYAIAPLIGVAPESLPNIFTRSAARILQFFVGRLPLSPAIRGNVSDDPRVEEDFFSDPRTYHGNLRISTGLSLLTGLTHLSTSAPSFRTPLRLLHGSRDRVTSPSSSQKFIKECGTEGEEKSIGVWEGYEHVMMRVGRVEGEGDDRGRERVLEDMVGWLEGRK
ncbi:alpha/beta-hydrolase [Sistotremastrum niveocremeum HHB9708]|uniref:Alpha/beta-hydrolase n=1 Tax=Sistotremastrum niveocremeum HHB9708 TaxID=1314777 RepID=A0A164SKV7_9AGAM|nr:alpha/beta-hydrolase [Sistotremastrum niveocremeum HHB9708]